MRNVEEKNLALSTWLAAVAFIVADASFATGQPPTVGEWGAVIPWPNVAIHAHLLPNGKVLFWGRREWNTNVNPPKPAEGLDPHRSIPRIWDPVTGTFSTTPEPKDRNGNPYNVFCAGHAFLDDGRLLVVGGHIEDLAGVRNASIYDYATNTWTPIDDMIAGRWYPTAVTLPDGRVLVSSGTDELKAPNFHQQIMQNGSWTETVTFFNMPLYPRLHVVGDGRVFMSGPLRHTQLLSVGGAGQWTPVGDRLNPADTLEYGSAVMYDVGKVIVMGGGIPPKKSAEVIDLNGATPMWTATDDMNFARRQLNATLLPDGTVLVTGGTQGDRGKPDTAPSNFGFNDLRIGQPIRSAESWDPGTGNWTRLARMDVDRCYHSVAVLLPDGRVLCAGGGEYKPDNVHQNALEDSHLNAQIFSPPYLFRGNRPMITSAPHEVHYGDTFDVGTSNPDSIHKVNWVRLSSVTHAFDQNQRFNSLSFSVTNGELKVTAPPNRNHAPPGHYMLFLLNSNGVPSIGSIIRIH
jgi:galactose oxidase